MKYAVRVFVRKFVRDYVRNIRADRTFYFGVFVILFVLLMSYTHSHSAEYEYKGTYPFQAVVTQYCEDCYLELPPDLMHTEIVLSVSTDSPKSLYRAIVAGAKAQGWNITTQGKKLVAEPVQNDGNVVYISCLDNLPHNVPKYLYSAQVRSDAILCKQRDSLAQVQRITEDSLNLVRQQKEDSTARYRDSLASVPPLDFRSYELRYYSYSKSFTDKVGMEWGSIIWSGDLSKKFHVYEDWKLWATENNDTTFNYRNMFLSVDSVISVDWGSEEQSLSKTYQTDGVVTQEFEWRKYGIIITIERDSRRVKMHYTFRDKDNSISVLQGSVIGNEGDTLFLRGDYIAKREISSGLPLLAKIPVIRLLFATQNYINDLKEFELYLIPQRSLKRLRDRTVENLKPIIKETKDEKN